MLESLLLFWGLPCRTVGVTFLGKEQALAVWVQGQFPPVSFLGLEVLQPVSADISSFLPALLTVAFL